MKLEEILTEWEADSPIRPTDLSGSQLDSPKLYSKYLRKYTTAKLGLKKLEQDMRELSRDKRDYYSGVTDRETLRQRGLEPFRRTLLKDDVPNWVAADQEVGSLRLRIDYQAVLVDTLDKILTAVANRRWEIRNSMDWLRFQSGG